MQTYGKVDSKFRFVILASKRAKQILKGAKVKIRSKSKNPIRIAQIEVKTGLVDYEILKTAREDLAEVEEQVLSVDAGHTLTRRTRPAARPPATTRPAKRRKPKRSSGPIMTTICPRSPSGATKRTSEDPLPFSPAVFKSWT